METLAVPASIGSIGSGLTPLTPGSGVIFLRDREYSDGTLHRLPGHIAVVTDVRENDRYQLVQTKSSAGEVVVSDWRVGEMPDVRTPYGIISPHVLAAVALQQMAEDVN
jgi:hypothetical protein